MRPAYKSDTKYTQSVYFTLATAAGLCENCGFRAHFTITYCFFDAHGLLDSKCCALIAKGLSCRISWGRTWYTPGSNLVSPGADFPPHCVRRAVLDAKTLENGRKWPFPSWRPKPLKSTPLLGIDFRQKPDLAKIYPLCRIAFSTNAHQLGPSILTKFGQNGGLNPSKTPKNGFLVGPPRPGGAGTSPTSRQVRRPPTPT